MTKHREQDHFLPLQDRDINSGAHASVRPSSLGRSCRYFDFELYIS
jgi:hypothetical protein